MTTLITIPDPPLDGKSEREYHSDRVDYNCMEKGCRVNVWGSGRYVYFYKGVKVCERCYNKAEKLDRLQAQKAAEKERKRMEPILVQQRIADSLEKLLVLLSQGKNPFDPEKPPLTPKDLAV